MCKSSFTLQKLLKLYLQITFYAVLIYGIFCLTGHETFSPFKALSRLFPIAGIDKGFTSCFLIFYLFIPFLNILLKHLDKRVHTYLVTLLIGIYSVIPNIPYFAFTFNYVEWFIALYFIASWLRFYGGDLKINHWQWGILTLFSILISSASVLSLLYLKLSGRINNFFPYHFVADSNQILALSTGICSFMWFKDIKMKYLPWINAIGSTTFGVLLIHANSDTMRQWLWEETVDCVGHFGPSAWITLSYAIISVLTIFIVCSLMDWLRLKLIEPHLIGFSETFFTKYRQKLTGSLSI